MDLFPNPLLIGTVYTLGGRLHEWSVFVEGRGHGLSLTETYMKASLCTLCVLIHVHGHMSAHMYVLTYVHDNACGCTQVLCCSAYVRMYVLTDQITDEVT